MRKKLYWELFGAVFLILIAAGMRARPEKEAVRAYLSYTVSTDSVSALTRGLLPR